MHASGLLVLTTALISSWTSLAVAGDPLILDQMQHHHKVGSNTVDLTTRAEIDAWTRSDSLRSNILILTNINDFEKKLSSIITSIAGREKLRFVQHDTKFDIVISKSYINPTTGGAVINFKGSLYAERVTGGIITAFIDAIKGAGRQKIIDEGLNFTIPISFDLSLKSQIAIRFAKIKIDLRGTAQEIAKLLEYLPVDINIVETLNSYVNANPLKPILFPFPSQMLAYGLSVNKVNLHRERGVLFAETRGEMQVPVSLINSWAQATLASYTNGDRATKVKVSLPNSVEAVPQPPR